MVWCSVLLHFGWLPLLVFDPCMGLGYLDGSVLTSCTVPSHPCTLGSPPKQPWVLLLLFWFFPDNGDCWPLTEMIRLTFWSSLKSVAEFCRFKSYRTQFYWYVLELVLQRNKIYLQVIPSEYMKHLNKTSHVCFIFRDSALWAICM